MISFSDGVPLIFAHKVRKGSGCGIFKLRSYLT
jgi:hypothetical protein